MALASFAKAIAARPVPPDARAGLACYELRIAAFRALPVPIVSCGIDGSGGVSCIWPFKKVTAVSGQLLDVDYSANPGGPVNYSLLRSAR